MRTPILRMPVYNQVEQFTASSLWHFPEISESIINDKEVKVITQIKQQGTLSNFSELLTKKGGQNV
jgi:hypothetical protein